MGPLMPTLRAIASLLLPARRRPGGLIGGLILLAALVQPVAANAQVGAAGKPSPPTPTLTLSDDGSLVIDTRAQLAWPRCAEGMRWNGQTCTGQAALYTHAQAQQLARQRWQDSGVRWRLPRVNELRRLVNRSTQPPSIDTRLFPASPQEWHWTGTASVNTSSVNPYAYGNVMRGGEGAHQLSAQQAWAVDMATGEARGDTGRGTPLAVRLVRPAP